MLTFSLYGGWVVCRVIFMPNLTLVELWLSWGFGMIISICGERIWFLGSKKIAQPCVTPDLLVNLCLPDKTCSGRQQEANSRGYLQ